MARGNIFLNDIDVPELVQQKADIAFSEIRMEGEHAMKKEGNLKTAGTGALKERRFGKLFAAAAACAALTVAVCAISGIFIRSDFGLTGEEGSAVSVMEKMFTLHVEAAELEAGRPVPLAVDAAGNSWVLGGSEDGQSVNYCISAPFTCEGDDIERVTYSINDGAFQVVQPTGESIIVDGILYDGELNAGRIGGDYDEKNDGRPSRAYETVLYQSFTLDYDRQSDEYTWINICNECPDEGGIRDLIWGEGRSAEDRSAGINKMLENIVINCTVQYADGTSQSADILVGSRVMEEENGEESGRPGQRREVITFELQ